MSELPPLTTLIAHEAVPCNEAVITEQDILPYTSSLLAVGLITLPITTLPVVMKIAPIVPTYDPRC